MARLLAIDYGRKRTGIAVSDTLQIIANGLTTVPSHTSNSERLRRSAIVLFGPTLRS